MSTTASHIIELVKSLSEEDQKTVRAALFAPGPSSGKTLPPLFLRDAHGNYYNPEGIPNDDPTFAILEEIEAQRHRTEARPLPPLD